MSGQLKKRGEQPSVTLQNEINTCNETLWRMISQDISRKREKGNIFLHHADVMHKLQSERQQFVVGVGSKQTIVHNLRESQREQL